MAQEDQLEVKANAPEKIYVQLPSRNWIGRTWNETPIKDGDNPNWKNATNIEYTCTDAFIKKAVEWLSANADKYIWYSDYAENIGDDTCGMNDDFIEDFKDYMKGE